MRVYYHVVADQYPDREVTASLFYTSGRDQRRINHLNKSDLREMVRTHRA